MNDIKKYYLTSVTGREADIYIYGDITSWEWFESDVSSYTLSQELASLDVDNINVYINSYGGEVAEGLAIHNELKRHKAKINTYCDGFACSAASVVFMAGDERYMYPASLLMIHNAWQYASGNADELRKVADDLDVISSAAANAYRVGLNITDEELEEMLASETWIDPNNALEKGFATAVIAVPAAMRASQSVRQLAMHRLLGIVKPAVSGEDHSEPTTPTQKKTKKYFNFGGK